MMTDEQKKLSEAQAAIDKQRQAEKQLQWQAERMKGRIANILNGNNAQICAVVLAEFLYDVLAAQPNPPQLAMQLMANIHGSRTKQKPVEERKEESRIILP